MFFAFASPAQCEWVLSRELMINVAHTEAVWRFKLFVFIKRVALVSVVYQLHWHNEPLPTLWSEYGSFYRVITIYVE